MTIETKIDDLGVGVEAEIDEHDGMITLTDRSTTVLEAAVMLDAKEVAELEKFINKTRPIWSQFLEE